MWEIAFYFIGAAAAAAVALHLRKQFSGSGCASCPYRKDCKYAQNRIARNNRPRQPVSSLQPCCKSTRIDVRCD